MQKLLACLAAVAFAATSAAQSPLSTLFASNNSGSAGGAVYFDLTVNIPVSITGIDLNSIGAAGTGTTLDVYTVPGGRAGNMGSQALWTGPSVLGSPITINANNTPSPSVLSTPLLLGPGVHGIALIAQGYQHAYTNGNGSNQQYTTVEMTLDAGNADNVPWGGGAFSPRVANVNIHYVPAGSGTHLATKTNYGQGCVTQNSALYEAFAAGTFDLTAAGSGVDNMSLIPGGSSYTALTGIASWVAPTTAATGLNLADDSETTVTLSQNMPVLSGSTGALTVCSNGFVSVASGNGTGFTPSTPAFLAFPQTVWSSWHDYNPAAGGQVWSEEIAGVHYITWDQVPSFGGTGGEDLQFQFDLNSGIVSIVWMTITNTGNNHIVGFARGGPSSNPGSEDLSALLAGGTLSAYENELQPITQGADARPIIQTVINVQIGNLTPGTLLGGTIIGLNQLGTPVDLTPFGMPTCFQYTDQLGVLLWFPGGATSASFPFGIPNMIDLNIHMQSVAYDPAAALTPLGATVSEATHFNTGDY